MKIIFKNIQPYVTVEFLDRMINVMLKILREAAGTCANEMQGINIKSNARESKC